MRETSNQNNDLLSVLQRRNSSAVRVENGTGCHLGSWTGLPEEVLFKLEPKERVRVSRVGGQREQELPGQKAQCVPKACRGQAVMWSSARRVCEVTPGRQAGPGPAGPVALVEPCGEPPPALLK